MRTPTYDKYDARQHHDHTTAAVLLCIVSEFSGYFPDKSKGQQYRRIIY